MDISIIIVNYNAGKLLYECVKSINDTISVDFEIIVIDNCSADNSIAELREINTNKSIQIILNQSNVGFSKANNIASELAKGRYFHFLNPDTTVSDDLNLSYHRILEEHSELYVTKLADSNGQIVKSDNLIFTPTNLLKKLVGKAHYWYTGASIIIRSDIFRKIGGWTPDYFMYSEDMDLFYKTSRLGITPKIVTSVVKHIGKACTEKVWTDLQREIKVQSAFKLFFRLNRTMFEYYLMLLILFLRHLFKQPSYIKFFLKVLYQVNFNKY